MKRRIIVIGVAGCFALLSACADLRERPGEYKVGQAGAITSVAQFDAALASATGDKGKEIRLAGSIQGLESTEEGYELLAKWLPYPAGFRMATPPEGVPPDQLRRYVVHFHGKPADRFDRWRGNKFVLEGKVLGTKKTVVDAIGRSKDLLYVSANCVHVWETGQTGFASDPDSEYDARGRTFCAKEMK